MQGINKALAKTRLNQYKATNTQPEAKALAISKVDLFFQELLKSAEGEEQIKDIFTKIGDFKQSRSGWFGGDLSSTQGAKLLALDGAIAAAFNQLSPQHKTDLLVKGVNIDRLAASLNSIMKNYKGKQRVPETLNYLFHKYKTLLFGGLEPALIKLEVNNKAEIIPKQGYTSAVGFIKKYAKPLGEAKLASLAQSYTSINNTRVEQKLQQLRAKRWLQPATKFSSRFGYGGRSQGGSDEAAQTMAANLIGVEWKNHQLRRAQRAALRQHPNFIPYKVKFDESKTVATLTPARKVALEPKEQYHLIRGKTLSNLESRWVLDYKRVTQEQEAYGSTKRMKGALNYNSRYVLLEPVTLNPQVQREYINEIKAIKNLNKTYAQLVNQKGFESLLFNDILITPDHEEKIIAVRGKQLDRNLLDSIRSQMPVDYSFQQKHQQSHELLLNAFIDLAQTLTNAHQSNPVLIHNDIKPDNMVIRELIVKPEQVELKFGLIDWGLARNRAIRGGTSRYLDAKLWAKLDTDYIKLQQLTSLNSDQVSMRKLARELQEIGIVKDQYALLISFLEIRYGEAIFDYFRETNTRPECLNGLRPALKQEFSNKFLAKLIKPEYREQALTLLNDPVAFAQSEYKHLSLAKMLIDPKAA